MSTDTFVIVDGSSFLFRAFHALPPLTNGQGQPTGAMYGVLNMLRKLLRDVKPQYVAVIFDAKGKNFRHDLYQDYKANRDEMPSDLQCQVEPLHRMIKRMGLPLVIESGVEADDVIGTLTQLAKQQHLKVIIATGDKDLAQLVDPQVTLVNTMTDSVLDEAGVLEKFGVPPHLIIDYFSLIGDKVDNVPGIANVGPKTAEKWLNTYGSLQAIIDNAHAITGKVGENLRAGLEFLPLAKLLITVKTDLPLAFDLAQFKPRLPALDELAQDYMTYGFKSWLQELTTQPTTSDAAIVSEPTPQAYELVLTEAQLDDWLILLKQAGTFAFDTETTSLDYMQAQLVGFSVAVSSGKAAYIPFGHRYIGAPEQLEPALVLAKFKPLLSDPTLGKVGQHIKYDMNVLANHGIVLQGVRMDTMLASYVYNSTATRHDMDSLALTYLNYKTTTFAEVAGSGSKQITFDNVEITKACHYAAEDADITWRLYETLTEKLQSSSALMHVLTDIELPLIAILSAMECTGVLIDSKLLAEQGRVLSARLTGLEGEIYVLAGEKFNINSPKQLQTVLFEKLNLPILQKTPTGQPSTAEETLQTLAETYELPSLILEYRSLSKLKSTYIDQLPLCIDPRTGRVHTSYHQANTSTGRLSSSDPNLQNIPVRTAEGRAIRQAFIAPAGMSIVAADYSQIELRIMAHLSQDPGLLHAFANNLDIHQATAAEVFGVELAAVTADQRRHAKAINFGLIYGMSAFGLSKQIDVGRNEAQAYIDRYFERYPQVKNYMDNTRTLVHAQGYIETLFGRRLYLPEIHSKNKQRVMAAERAAINGPMQGTAADIIKRAMINTAHAIQQSPLNITMIMQVHDELVFEVADLDIAAATTLIQTQMMQAAQLDVPLLVSVGVGKNWEAAH